MTTLTEQIIFCFLTTLVTLTFIQPAPVMSQTIEEMTGRELFIQNRCTRCHTIGRGRFVGPDLDNIEDKYTEEEIVRWIMNPQAVYSETQKMPLNEGYPPMPNMNVPEKQAKKIMEYVTDFQRTVSDAEYGSIEGNVFNYSRDRERMNDVGVILRSFMGDRETGKERTQTDSSGKFVFEDLQWNRSYQISILYGDAEYTTDKMVFAPDQNTMDLDLPVYDPTQDSSDISIQQYHVVADVQEGLISIAEIIDIKNTGNRIFTGSENPDLNLQKQTMVLKLAPNAENIDLVQGLNRNNLLLKENTIYDTTGIAPGYKRMTVTYDIPFDQSDISIEKKPYFKTENMLVLISESFAEAKVSGLNKGENVEFHNRTYSRWQGSGLNAKDVVRILIKKPVLSSKNIRLLIPVFLFILVLGAGIFYNLVYKNRKKS